MAPLTHNTRTAIVVGVALAMGGVASFATYRAVVQYGAHTTETVPVVVMASARPIGTLVTAGDLKVVQWPKHFVVPGAIASTEAVVGRGLIAGLMANEPVTEARLAPRGSGAGLPPAIPPGMRAIAVRVNDVSGVAGYITPGARVDVLATVGARNAASCDTVVSNVTVLTMGRREPVPGTMAAGRSSEATVATLLVTPEQAERVALAAASGEVMLLLRNPTDPTFLEDPCVAVTDLMGAKLAPPPPPGPPPARRASVPAPAVAPPPPVYTVDVIRGSNRTKETLP